MQHDSLGINEDYMLTNIVLFIYLFSAIFWCMYLLLFINFFPLSMGYKENCLCTNIILCMVPCPSASISDSIVIAGGSFFSARTKRYLIFSSYFLTTNWKSKRFLLKFYACNGSYGLHTGLKFLPIVEKYWLLFISHKLRVVIFCSEMRSYFYNAWNI